MNWKDELLCVSRLRATTLPTEIRKVLNGDADMRNQLESDFGRVVFSPACRRLHDKTQVFPLTSNDNIHSRLTHSLEVMNMGLSFCINLSQNEKFKKHTGLDEVTILRSIGAILKTSCLVHDIGNPPFGHFGEEVIKDYFSRLFENLKRVNSQRKIAGKNWNDESEDYGVIWTGIVRNNYLNKDEKAIPEASILDEDRKNDQIQKLEEFLACEDDMSDYTLFDGNAEGLRILTKLQYLGDLYGLNLTVATLAACIKYPNPTHRIDKNGQIELHKHGVMTTEILALNEVVAQCGLRAKEGDRILRHPLAYLMEAADSICYLVMDLDDAYKRRWIDYSDIETIVNGCKAHDNNINNMCKQTVNNNTNPDKNWLSLRTAILSYLTKVAHNNFVNNLDAIERGEYNKELIEDGDDLAEKLKSFSMKKILAQRDINSLETTGKAVITGLLDQYYCCPVKVFR